MLPINAPKPKDWTDKDKWMCTARWLEALSNALYDWGPDCSHKTGIPCGEKGDPCYECPAGERCPCWCDENHWKRFAEVYAYENFKIVEQFLDSDMGTINTILKRYYDVSVRDCSWALKGIDAP